jgi:hypothetical protein
VGISGFDNFLEGLTEVRKALIFILWIVIVMMKMKIKKKNYTRQCRRKINAIFQLSSPIGVIWTELSFSSSDPWQYILTVPTRGAHPSSGIPCFIEGKSCRSGVPA